MIRLLMAVALMGMTAVAWGQRQSDIASTRHNLSVTGPGPVRASSESEICVFCHTPHGANTQAPAPLWNRQLSGATYTPYTSSSLDAEAIRGAQLAQPGGTSKLCLSCHDGTLALGTVTNAPGSGLGGPIAMTGTAGDGTMPAGDGTLTGFTRDLGTDLRNDHPISLTFDTTLADRDGELVDPAGAAHLAAKAEKPLLPLEPTGQLGELQIQCATCHDPHLFDPNAAASIKFLRADRFQSDPPIGSFDGAGGDMICLGCHEKAGWHESAHADPTVATEQYTASAAAQRDFPAGIQVWEAGCSNCHDPHTVHGARRLLREGTDSTATPKAGGDSAIEESCYQCHTSGGGILSTTNNQVPDIETEFNLPIRMPITSLDQRAGIEVHDIGTGQDGDEGPQRGADFIEDQALLGKGIGNLDNRHAECTDCHNPHRLIKNSRFNGTGTSAQATHDHTDGHSNIASGALRGAWGVEPNYGAAEFFSLPNSYTIKRGNPALGASEAVTANYVTREYQICLKCHSDYAYDDDGTYDGNNFDSGRPELGLHGGGTPAGTNNMDVYTNQAMEFQAPASHQGEVTAPGQDTNNHRSWHPVIGPTGRSLGVRNMGTGLWLNPWDGANVGSQTMYCSDCHGRRTAQGTAEPPAGRPWGPHGSESNFLLKGDWDSGTGGGAQNDLCFKCHEYDAYGNPEASENFTSGFETDRGNGHYVHNTDDKVDSPIRCSWCHVAVPHGWQNKALLVDISQEPGCPTNGPCNFGPYYNNAFLGSNGQSVNWRPSGQWRFQDCGGDALMKDGACGRFR